MKKIPVERFTRMVGYFQRIENSNKGKQSEIKDRYLHDPQKINLEVNNG